MSIDPSSSSEGNSVFAEFLADYFIECDEHLTVARRCILDIEPQLHQARIDRRLLDELFRSFHSLKGLSAMVGFHESEQLAHQLESYLSALRKNQVRLALEGLEILVAGVAALEQIIAARRDSGPLPDVTPLVQRVTDLLPPGGTLHSQSDAIGSSSATERSDWKTRNRGRFVWQVQFAPSAELVQRGIDVSSVRKTLQELGEVVHSSPQIDRDGQIAFHFVVASDDPRAIENLPQEGITWQLADTAPIDEEPSTSLVHTSEVDTSTHLTPANLVRVDLGRLDELIRLVGELVLSRARLADGLRRLQSTIPGAELRALQETNGAIERQLRELREGVMRVRMVSVREVFSRMQFVVRDLVREMGKQAILRFSGEDTQIDKYVVERIMDPLLHLVRNAVGHGLESATERVAKGKPAEGRIDLRAKTTGETVIIEVADDGRGIDIEAIFAQARSRGFISPQTPTNRESLLEILCKPGFSTREQPDRTSGRGVGMDVVRQSVEEMGGLLTVDTTPGRGTRFVIQLPLTLAITDALIVQVGTERFAVPQIAIREVIDVNSGHSTLLENNELLRFHGGVIPLLRLSRLFGLNADEQNTGYALVSGEGVQAFGLVVHRLLGLREVVVRPLTDRLVKVPGVAGATELGDGRVVLILDVMSLSRLARKQGAAGAGWAPSQGHQPEWLLSSVKEATS